MRRNRSNSLGVLSLPNNQVIQLNLSDEKVKAGGSFVKEKGGEKRKEEEKRREEERRREEEKRKEEEKEKEKEKEGERGREGEEKKRRGEGGLMDVALGVDWVVFADTSVGASGVCVCV